MAACKSWSKPRWPQFWSHRLRISSSLRAALGFSRKGWSCQSPCCRRFEFNKHIRLIQIKSFLVLHLADPIQKSRESWVRIQEFHKFRVLGAPAARLRAPHSPSQASQAPQRTPSEPSRAPTAPSRVPAAASRAPAAPAGRQVLCPDHKIRDIFCKCSQSFATTRFERKLVVWIVVVSI